MNATPEQIMLKIVELIESGRKGGEFQIQFGPYAFDWRGGWWTVVANNKIVMKKESLTEAVKFLLEKEERHGHVR